MVSKVDPVKAQMENQEWWKKKIPEYCEVLRNNESYRKGESHPTEEPWASMQEGSAQDALVQVGLIGGRELFKQIPTCLPQDIRDNNNIPPYRISRIALRREEGGSEQLLIQGVDGEQVLLAKRLVDVPRRGLEWRWVIQGEFGLGYGSVHRLNPSLMSMSGYYEYTLAMIDQLQKAEGVMREALGAVGPLPPGVEALIISYDGYATPQEKTHAESNRHQVMNRIEANISVTPYQLFADQGCSRAEHDAIVKDLSPPAPAKPQDLWEKIKGAFSRK